MKNIRLTILLLFLATPATVPAAYLYTDIYVFGDSLSDTQARETNGELWVEYLAPRLGISYNADNNFARSGADTSAILDQVDAYLSGNSVDADALYVVWGGAMDIFNNPLDPYSAIAPATSNLASAVGSLSGSGADNILVPNLPDLGLTPAAIDYGIVDQARAVSVAFNNALETALSGYELFGLDVYALLNDAAANPGDYGLSNVTGSCVDDGADPLCDGYLFYDVVHPTTRGHEILADAMYAQVVPLPASSLLLASGLFVIGLPGWCRRRGRSPGGTP